MEFREVGGLAPVVLYRLEPPGAARSMFGASPRTRADRLRVTSLFLTLFVIVLLADYSGSHIIVHSSGYVPR